LVVSLARAIGTDEPDCPKSLQVMQKLAKEIGVDLRSSEPGVVDSSLSVRVAPKETAWPLEQDFVAGLKSGSVKGEGLPIAACELGLVDARVEYDNIRRDGFFGRRIVDRIVRIAVRVKLEAAGGSRYREFRKEARDTVGVSDVEHLETPGFPMTRGSLPSQGFFDDLLEPVVFLGSIGVAVYLLFVVRS
jgi:hypothetical protein